MGAVATCFSGRNCQLFFSKMGEGVDLPKKVHCCRTACFRASCPAFGTSVKPLCQLLTLVSERS